MKVLHAMNMIFPVDGIINQMRSEQLAANSMNLEWTSKIFAGFASPENLFEQWTGNTANRLSFKRSFYGWLEAIHEDYDVILLRHTPYDPLEYLFVKNAKRPVFLVLHTLYVAELASKKGLKSTLQSIGERFMGPLNFRSVYGIIAVTNEIGCYAKRQISNNKKVIIYPNGIYWKHLNIDSDSMAITEIPEVVFISSSIAPWHGTIQLINSIRCSDESFVFHHIGKSNAEFEKLAREDRRVVLHGRLEPHEFPEVTNRCAVGISSLAISSLGMKEACPLKTREYLLHGLPAYGAHQEPFPENFRFYRQGEADISSILSYAYEMRGVYRKQVAEQSKPFIDKEIILNKLMVELAESLVGQRTLKR